MHWFSLRKVRIEKRSAVATINGQFKLDAQLMDEVQGLTGRNVTLAINFLEDRGTHVIHRYITGDAIYQVLVYQPDDYGQLQERLGDFNIANATRANFIFLFPSPPTYVGKLQVILIMKTQRNNTTLVILRVVKCGSKRFRIRVCQTSTSKVIIFQH